MQLTRAADYAMRVMIHLASLPEGSKLPLKALSKATNAPESFLAKLLQGLTRAELLVSHRGPDGGFELPATARKATMLDVIQSIDGPIQLNTCLSELGCEFQDWCPAHLVWVQAQEAMLSILRNAKIDDLARLGGIRKEMLESG